MNVVGVYAGLEERVRHVHFGEQFSFAAVGKYVVDSREGETVSHGVAVECAIIVYPAGGGPSSPVFPLGISERRKPVRRILRKRVGYDLPSGVHLAVSSKILGTSWGPHIPYRC